MANNISRMFAAALFTLFLMGAGAEAAITDVKKDDSSDKLSDSVQHKILSFSLEGLTEKGAKNWDVHGETAESISENEVKLDNIIANSYGEESQATITADKGVYDKVQNNIKLRQNVKATIENTQDANSGYIGLDMPDKKDESVENQSGKKTVKTVITCDGDVIFDYQNNKAYFNRNVNVVSEDGNSMVADKITVNLEPNSKKINEIIADGNVKMLRGPNIAYSDRAKYVEKDKTVSLSGQPKIVVYDQGDTMTNFLGGGQDASSGNARSD